MHLLFPYFGYRSHHEFIIEAIRIRIEMLIDKQCKLENLREQRLAIMYKNERSE